MTLIEKIQNELIDRARKANWKAFTITMKKTNETLCVTPCSERVDEITDLYEVDYWLVYGGEYPWLGGDTVRELSEQLANYDAILADLHKTKAELARESAKLVEKDKIVRAMDDGYAKAQCMEELDYDWNIYSDIYKDCYGRRPILHVVTPYENAG